MDFSWLTIKKWSCRSRREGQEWAGVYFIGPTVDSSYAIKPAPRKT
jgi:hypothetical protein